MALNAKGGKVNQNHIQRVEKLAADAGETPHEFLTRIYAEEGWLTRTATRLGMDYHPLQDLMDKYGVKRRKHGGIAAYSIDPEMIVSRKGAGERLVDIAKEIGCRPKYLSDIIWRYRKARGESAPLLSDYDLPAQKKSWNQCLGCDKFFWGETKFHRRCDICKSETADIADDEPSRAYAAANVVFK